jgi:hypothetical protein
MKNLLPVLGLAVALLLSADAQAAKKQVSASSWKATGVSGSVYGRSDGIFQEANTKSPYIIENGTSTLPVGAGYRETFAYGDGKGLSQLLWSSGATAVGATTTLPVLAKFGSGVSLMWFPVVTATIPLDMDAGGLDIAGDQVANDGLEIVGGVLGASGRPFIIGDDPAFYFCATVKLADVSGSDDFHVGFREVDPFNAVFDDYTDLASIGSISGDIYIETIIGAAATVSTDTTDNWADLATKKLCTYVSNTGVTTYTINGVAPTTTAAYTFTDGLSVIPFIHYIHDADLADYIEVSLWEVGYTN